MVTNLLATVRMKFIMIMLATITLLSAIVYGLKIEIFAGYGILNIILMISNACVHPTYTTIKYHETLVGMCPFNFILHCHYDDVLFQASSFCQGIHLIESTYKTLVTNFGIWNLDFFRLFIPSFCAIKTCILF